MPVIELDTFINAPAEICFDLARSIDLHQTSMGKSKEKAIAGKTTGLIELNETVTWRAKHFGIWQTLTSKVIAYHYPEFFADEMVKGGFHSFRHEHHFIKTTHGTLMKDRFEFKTPLGWIGKIANQLFLTKYMTNLIAERNKVIKETAENGEWKKILNT
ncbi:MAG: SRPBCC family protein [Chitinophagaceae bacterium]|nr:SRPBCC family protein [Chitinophagaceae bacterium]